MNLALRLSDSRVIHDSEALLKRDLLYFDQVHICSYSHKWNELMSTEYMDPRYPNQAQKNFDYLKEQGLICTFDLSEMINFSVNEFKRLKPDLTIDDQRDMASIFRDFKKIRLPNPYKIKEKMLAAVLDVNGKENKELTKLFNDIDNDTVRLSSCFLNRFSSQDEAFPLLTTHKQSLIALPNQSKVLEVVLEKLPVPNENINWRQIVEYRSDPDSRGKFNALRTWMQDIARKDYTKQEIQERIEYLLYEYEKHLKFHKLKYSHSKLRIFVTTSLEILENTIKLKWGEVAKTIFSLTEKKYDLLESEFTGPGKEIAYLSNTKSSFR